MAVDVSRIPNNSKFDPVREAILDLEQEISSGVAGVSSVNNQTGAVTIAQGSNVSITTNNGVITISSTASGGGTLEGELTLAAGDGIGLSSPSVFDGSTDLTVTITNTDRPNDGQLNIITGAGISTATGETWTQKDIDYSIDTATWASSAGASFSANAFEDANITIEHGNTSDVPNVVNVGGNVIQSMGFDQFGHVQSTASVNLDNRYLIWRNIHTTNDNRTATASVYNDTLDFKGAGSIAVTKSPTSDEIRFGLAVSDIRFEDGKRVARGFLYWQGNTVPTPADLPSNASFSFDSYLITTGTEDWLEIPPFTGYSLTTYYITRYTSIDDGAGTTASRSVTFGNPQEATGFEGPVTFNSLAEELGSNGFTIIDGGRVKTGQIQSIGLNASEFDQGLSVYTQQGSFFNLGTGDIVTPEFSVVDDQAYFRGNVFVGQNLLTEQNTLNSNTTVNDVSGLGTLATQDTVAAAQITGLGDLALEDFVNANTQVTGLGALALLDAVTTNQVSGLGSLALLDTVSTNQVTGLGSLAVLDTVNTNQVVGLGALASLDTVDTSLVVGLGSLAVLDRLSTGLIDGLGALGTLNTIDSSFVTDLGTLATRNNVSAGEVLGLGGLAVLSSISASEIQSAAVTVDALANNAVTEGKIAANAVTEGKIVANAVVSSKIAANAIVSDKIATDAIISSKILAGAITTAKLSAGAVTAAKINAGDLAANTAFMNTLLATNATFTGTTQAGEVTISDSTIEMNNTFSEQPTIAFSTNGLRYGEIIAGNYLTESKISNIYHYPYLTTASGFPHGNPNFYIGRVPLSYRRYNEFRAHAMSRIQIGVNSSQTSSTDTAYLAITTSGTFVSGSFNVLGTKNFYIPHPKNEGESLVHSAIESPEVNNLYRGEVQLVNGKAEINLDANFKMTDGTFVLFNRKCNVFTTNESDWDNVRGKVEGNILTIECQNPESTATVSWLVITQRCDQSIIDSNSTDENGELIVETKTNYEE